MKYKELIKLNEEHKKEIEELKKQINILEQKVESGKKMDYIIKTQDNNYELVSKEDIELIKGGLEVKKEVLDVLKD